MAKIYLSSTYRDLGECRKEVYEALRGLRHDVISMEDYGASNQRPLNKCLADVAACDIYIGIFAWRYGFIPDKNNPEQKSITELEFRQAVKLDKPRLIFLLHENAEWKFSEIEEGDGLERIKAFRKELANDYIVSFFENKEDLAKEVVTAVANLLSLSPPQPAPIPIPPPQPLPMDSPTQKGRLVALPPKLRLGRLVATIGLLVALSGAIFYLIVIPGLGGCSVPNFVKGRPDTITEFREQFESLQDWTIPQKNSWSVNKAWLKIENSPEVGYLTNHRFRDFTMIFHLKLLDRAGATWALRVNEQGYYLFHLSGDENKFFTYLVRDCTLTRVGTPRDLTRPLQQNGVYELEITAQDNRFRHKIRISDTPDHKWEGEEYDLGEYLDPNRSFFRSSFFRTGSIGFITMDNNEKFAVAILQVYPLGTQKLKSAPIN